MARIVFGILAAVATFMLAESLTCNKCTFGLIGVCLNSGEETCPANSTVCFTAKASFASLPSFAGFNTQGCGDSTSGCNQTLTGTLLGVTYETKSECCSTDKCNPISLSGATANKMTLTAAIGVAVLASVWGSMQ